MISTPVQMANPAAGPRRFVARDPRVLIAVFLAVVVSIIAIPTVAGVILVAVYVFTLHRLAGVPARALLVHARALGTLFVLVLVVNGLLVEGVPLVPSIEWVSREGVVSGIHAGVRLFALYLGAAVFLSVAGPEDIAKGIAAILSPFSKTASRRAAMYVFLSVGFLPLFADEIRRVSIAQEFRGGGFGGGLGKKARGVRLLVVPLILSAVHRSSQLALAVEIRRIERNFAAVLVLDSVDRRDLVFLVTTVAVIAAAWIVF